jgi:hypothetical protein
MIRERTPGDWAGDPAEGRGMGHVRKLPRSTPEEGIGRPVTMNNCVARLERLEGLQARGFD